MTKEKNFSKRLLDWYSENKRDLPFRKEKDPYKIWISEIMAQQTQIATMLPYYERWIKVYPDVKSLADADIDEVLKLWEGLGYYRRARNLHAGAKYLMEHFDAKLPSTKEELMKIPGIGDYTASAIASIAFNQKEIVMDGNVKRVMARYLNYTENVNARKAHKVFESFLKEELHRNNADPSDFNQALMELGALVCTPSNTECLGCPFEEMCACWRGECTTVVPYIPKKKAIPSYPKSVFIYIKDHHILLSNDDSDGLMQGLLRLPQVSGHQDGLKEIYQLKHKFSHLEWDIKAYQVFDLDSFDDKTFFVSLRNLKDKHALVSAHRKILQKLELL